MNPKFRSERDLQNDLAEFLRNAGYLTYTEIEMPSTRGRMDVVALKPHMYTNACIKGYEVKLTRPVFLSDVQSQKYTRYMDTVNQLYFAAPQGVITKADLPPDTGLIVRTETGWHVQKAPRILRASKLGKSDFLALIYRGYECDKEGRRLSERVRLEENVELSKRVKYLGWQVAQRLVGTDQSKVEKWAEEFSAMIKKVVGDVKYDDWLGTGLPSVWGVEQVLKTCCAYRKHAEATAEMLEHLADTMRGIKDESQEARQIFMRMEATNEHD